MFCEFTVVLVRKSTQVVEFNIYLLKFTYQNMECFETIKTLYYSTKDHVP